MNRFKFRIWDIKQQKYRQRTHHEADTCLNCLSGKVLFGEGIEIYGEEDDKDVIPEQCTCLRDKNGKLIYEGDIVEFYSQSVLDAISGRHMERRVGKVIWNDEKLKFDVMVGDNPVPDLCRETDDNQFVVIGNIHEMQDEH